MIIWKEEVSKMTAEFRGYNLVVTDEGSWGWVYFVDNGKGMKLVSDFPPFTRKAISKNEAILSAENCVFKDILKKEK